MPTRAPAAFFALAFGISWLVWIPAALAARQDAAFPLSPELAGLVGAFGPTLAALVVTGLTRGRRGLRALLGRLLIWRIGLPWYLFVLLWPAAVSLTATGLYVLFGGTAPDFAHPPFLEIAPLPTELQAVGPWPLMPFVFLQNLLIGSAMGEEIGWRGFALPRLQTRWGALSASLLIGLLWGLWHLPLYLTPGHPMANRFFGWTLLDLLAISVLFTWVFNHTRGSLLPALLLHAAMSVTALFLARPEGSTVIALALTGAVALLIIRTGHLEPVDAD